MPLIVQRRMAAFLVLGLVLTSLPARVWLFGACPICGQIHVPILVVQVGPVSSDRAPANGPNQGPAGTTPDTRDDQSHEPHDGDFYHDCCPPLPYCSTAAPPPVVVSLVVDSLLPATDPASMPPPTSALIRPPRA